jgi:anti-sigma regulatory factor (Ser/Thr protein kinase)
MIFKNIQSTFQEVDATVESVKECFQGLECPKLSAKKNIILLALRELLNNAVKHGNHLDNHKKIMYEIGCDGRKFQLDVWDEGLGFRLPDHRGDESVNGVLHMSSRGLFIIQKMNFQLSVTAGHVSAILDL